MLLGFDYDSGDKQLVEDRKKAKTECQAFNAYAYEMTRWARMDIFKKLLGKTSDEFTIEPSFYCDYGYNISFGNNFYSNHNLVILDATYVDFGDNVFIGPNCGFYTSNHPIEYKIRNTYLESAKPIKIGDNVWIGGNVCVMSGVTIGSGSVIGAGSIVVKDIPENVVAVGNPCTPIKNINL